MVQVEVHDGTSYQVQAEMVYNGMGQRLATTAHQAGQSLTSNYLLDGSQTLAATADGQTTYYLNGVGEYQADWIYYLADGTNSVRLSDPQGQVTLTCSFTLWGENHNTGISYTSSFFYYYETIVPRVQTIQFLTPSQKVGTIGFNSRNRRSSGPVELPTFGLPKNGVPEGQLFRTQGSSS